MSAANAEVLLAEDNPSDAELVFECLASEVDAGRIHRVHDGVEALDFLFSRGTYAARGVGVPLRLVLLDIKLPRVGGLEVLEEMRASPILRFTPVVMLTSSKVERDVVTAYKCGANGYVQKPVDFAHFRKVVQCVSSFWLTINEAPPHDIGATG